MSIDLRVSNEMKKSAVASIEAIGAVAQQLEMKESEKDLRNQARQLMDDSFRIMVAGRFRNGKSTLVNALLGKPTVRIDGLAEGQGPMLVTYVSTTAVLTSVSYAEKVFVRKWTFDGKFENWTMERYLREAKVRPDEEETEKFFANIREFQMGYPSDILRQGVTLIDSPGLDDTPQRTAITNEAAQTCDAAIVVFRSDILASKGERDTIQNVFKVDGTHNFIVVNLMHGHKADEDFKQWAWNRLVKLMRGGPSYSGQDFATQDIYFVDARMAEEGKLTGNQALVAASGLDKLERRMSEFLTTERHRQHIEKFVRGAIRLAEPVSEQIRRRSAALRTETDELMAAYQEVMQRLDKIEEPKHKVPAIFEKYKRRAIRETVESFEREIMHLERELPALLQDYALPSGDKWTSIIHQQRMTEEAYEFCQKAITDRLERWASSATGGARKTLDPILEAMMEDVQHEINQIEKVYRSFYLKIGGPEFGAAGANHLSWYERAGWIAAGLLMHDVGLAVGGGAMGWRGAAATLGSYVVATVGGLILGLSLGAIIPIAIISAAVAQMVLGKAALANFVKKAVIEKVLTGDSKAVPPRPPLSALATTAAPMLETNVGEQIDNTQRALLDSIATIVAEEQRNLKAIIENSQHSAAEKERVLAKLSALAGQIATSRRDLEDVVAEAKQVLA